MKILDEKIRALSSKGTSKNLLELVEAIKSTVADVRTPLKVKPDIENEVRLGIIEALDLYIAEPLRTLRGELERPNPDEMT